MKQYLHFIWATMLATAITPAFAQTSDDPLVVTVGENVAPDGNCSFTFDATETGLLHLSLYLSSSDSVIEVAPDGSSTAIGMATDYNNGTDFYVKSGYTYNFGATVHGEQTYTVSVSPTQNAFLGGSCDAPMVLGKEDCLLIPFYAPDYGTSTHFFEFTPDITGKLKVYADISFRSLSVAEGCDTGWDDLDYEFDYGSSLGTYVYTLLVDEGQTYIFQAIGSSGTIVKCDLYEVISGASCEDPFYVSAGEVEIPAAAGTYYYQFSTPESPMYSALVVSSDAKGSVVLETSCAGYNQSYFDSLNFRKVPVPSNSSYIIEFIKDADTAAPESFTLAFENLLPIEDSETGEAITFDTEYTTPEGDSTYYYSFSLPDNSNPKFLTLTSDAKTSSYGGPFKLHERGASYPLFGQGANFNAEVKAGVDYILEVTVPAATQYTFSLGIEDMKPGQTANYPIEAVVGDNPLPAFTPVYLSYSQETSGYLEISPDNPDAKLTVSTLSEWGYAESVMLSATDNGWKFECIEGKVYSFAVETSGQAVTLSINQMPYEEGESMDTAIVVDMTDAVAYETLLPEGPSKVWYKMEAPISGFFNLSTTMTQHYSSEVAVYVNSLSNKSTVNVDYATYAYADFKGAVVKGDMVYVCFNNTQVQHEPTAKFWFSEAAPGEASSNPLMLEYTEPSTLLSLPTIQNNAYVWYGIELPEGLFNIRAKTSCTIKLYSAENPSTQLAENTWNYNTGEYNLTDFPLPGAGSYLLCLTSNYTEGNEVELFVAEPLPGQTAGTAIALDVIGGENVLELPEASEQQQWYKFDANAGQFSILGSNGGYFGGSLYKADDLSAPVAMVASQSLGDDLYAYGIADFTVDSPGTYYLCITRNYANLTITFSGSAFEPYKEPDFVAVSIEVTDGQNVTYYAPNHAETSFAVAAPAGWTVESCTINGNEVGVESLYTVAVDNIDVEVMVTLAYDGDVAFVDTTTGVVSLDARVTISVADGKVVLNNVSVGDDIKVYSIGGLLVGHHTAQDTAVEISLPSGTYIVIVNNNAAKVQL